MADREFEDYEVEECDITVGSEDSVDVEISAESVEEIWEEMTASELAFGVAHTPQPSSYLPLTAQAMFHHYGSDEATFNTILSAGERAWGIFMNNEEKIKPRPMAEVANDHHINITQLAEIMKGQCYKHEKNVKVEPAKDSGPSTFTGPSTSTPSVPAEQLKKPDAPPQTKKKACRVTTTLIETPKKKSKPN